MSAPLRLGIVGCGRATEHLHLPAIARCREVRLVGAADPSPVRLDLVKARVAGCAVFPSIEELFDALEIDAILIASPPENHVAAAMEGVRQGIPALVEKPLARTRAEAEGLRTLGTAATDGIMMAFNRRYWVPVLRLRRTLLRHQMASAAAVRMVMTSNAHGWSALSGVPDPLDDLCSHQLDLLRFLFGRELRAVRATRPAADVIEMRVALEGGVVADCRAAQARVSEETIEVGIAGARCQVRLGSERIRPANGPLRSAIDLSERVVRRLTGRRSSLRATYSRQLERFVEFVRLGACPEPGLADGFAVVCAVEAARESIASGGKEIKI